MRINTEQRLYMHRILLEFFYPNTFDGLCVTEPVMSRIMVDAEIRAMFPVLASRKRRDEWASR